MELVVDLSRVTVVLSRPEEVDRLSVRVGAPEGASPGSVADVHRLHDVLVATSVGRLDRLDDPGRAIIRPDAVAFHAAGQVADDWEDRFARLCREAAARADGAGPEREAWVPAPITWPSGPGTDPPA